MDRLYQIEFTTDLHRFKCYFEDFNFNGLPTVSTF